MALICFPPLQSINPTGWICKNIFLANKLVKYFWYAVFLYKVNNQFFLHKLNNLPLLYFPELVLELASMFISVNFSCGESFLFLLLVLIRSISLSSLKFQYLRLFVLQITFSTSKWSSLLLKSLFKDLFEEYVWHVWYEGYVLTVCR